MYVCMYVLDAKKHGQEARLLEAAPEPPEAGSSLLTTGGPAARGGARTAGGWFVLTDVDLDAISALCTSTEPSWHGSTRPGAVSVSHQRLLSSGHMARVCLEAPSDVSSTEPLQHRRRDGDPHIVLRERGLGGDH